MTEAVSNTVPVPFGPVDKVKVALTFPLKLAVWLPGQLVVASTLNGKLPFDVLTTGDVPETWCAEVVWVPPRPWLVQVTVGVAVKVTKSVALPSPDTVPSALKVTVPPLAVNVQLKVLLRKCGLAAHADVTAKANAIASSAGSAVRFIVSCLEVVDPSNRSMNVRLSVRYRGLSQMYAYAPEYPLTPTLLAFLSRLLLEYAPAIWGILCSRRKPRP